MEVELKVLPYTGIGNMSLSLQSVCSFTCVKCVSMLNVLSEITLVLMSFSLEDTFGLNIWTLEQSFISTF